MRIGSDVVQLNPVHAVVKDTLIGEGFYGRRSRVERQRVRVKLVLSSGGFFNGALGVRRGQDGYPFGNKTAHAADVIEMKVSADQITYGLSGRGRFDLRNGATGKPCGLPRFNYQHVIFEDYEETVIQS